MATTTVKKQLDEYLPLLSDKQQALLLEMVKSFLNVDQETKRITRKQYNKEITEAVDRVEEGNFITHDDAIKELINKHLSHIEDISFLNAIKTIIESKVSGGIYKLSDFQKGRIDSARQQLSNGQTISHNELQKEIDQWLSTK